MKKIALTLTAAVICSTMSVFAQNIDTLVPIGCPLKKPCASAQPAPEPCTPDCECTPEDVCALKAKFLEKRCCVYEKVGLTQEQISRAKCIDEKFFDEIHPLKDCYKKEKCKLKEMECNKACASDIKCQKEKVRDLKRQIKEKKKAHHEAILCLMNECQKKIYKKICKENKKEHECNDTCDCNCK